MKDAARWERVQDLFHLASDLPVAARRAFLEGACAGDETLLADVELLLEEDARGGSLLDRGLPNVAQEVLGMEGTPPLPPQSFGPYRVRGMIGEGGMGVVYLAEREDLGSVAAIKILRDAWLSPARRERFASEQRTLAQLNHPFIARLYDADVLADGTPWFVMEYVEGLPLTEHCRRRGASIKERLRLFRDVGEAVQHAHRHAIIHRDLKPSNILVTADGGVKLLDFGIAKQIETLDLAAEKTRTGLRLMTPAYAAPEQVLAGRLGVHTDVYSLGVILYELLAGRIPFDLSDSTPSEAESMIVHEEPVRPSAAARETGRTLGKAAWADLDVLCLTAMHKDPARRYPTVEALLRDVDHYLEGEPLEARPDSLSYRAGKFVRKHRRPVVAAALGFAVVVGLVAFYTARVTNARNAALAEAARTQRIQRFMLNLFEGGDEAVGPADSMRVTTLIDRGVQEARSLGSDPEIQAELMETLGGIDRMLGRLDRADSLLSGALAQRRELFGPSHPDVAASLVNLGILRIDQAEYEEAERLIRGGLEMARRTLPGDHPEIAEATMALGKVLEERGENEEAIRVLEEAVRIYSTVRSPTPELAASLSELANVHFYAGDYAASDSLNRLVLPMSRLLHGDQHPLVADDLINLGAIRFQLGDYVEAERYYREGLTLVEAWYGSEHHRTAASLTMLGRALVFQNRFDEAVAVLRRSLEIQHRVFGETHPRVASALNELGSVALQRGQLDSASAYYARTAEIYRAINGEKHPTFATALSNQGSVSMARQDWRGAESLLRRARDIYTEALAPDHLNVGIARIKLGRSLLRQGRFEDACRESRAGHDIVASQTSPSVSWLTNARKDLAEEYEALGDASQAASFRAELKKSE